MIPEGREIPQAIKRYIVNASDTVYEVMCHINAGAKGIAYVYENGRLYGTVSDGDIRRYIIKNGNLDEPVRGIANKKYRFITSDNYEEAMRIMRRAELSSIPLLNEQHVIEKIFFLQSGGEPVIKQVDAPVVIMAGGIGSRLQPYTNILPKPLIPIGEKTITEHIIERFMSNGCKHFDMIVNYKRNFIQSYFSDLETSYDIDFVIEETFMGTGGGLRLLRERYTQPFFLTNCDILVEEDYAGIYEMHVEQKNVITMVCAIKNIRLPYGTVHMTESGEVMRLEEKPSLSFMTNTGLYVVSPEFIEMIPDEQSVPITDVIQTCVDTGKRVGVYPISEERWYDMGQFEEMERMKRHLANEASLMMTE